MARFLFGLASGILLTALVPVLVVALGMVDMGARTGPRFLDTVFGDRAFHRWVAAEADEAAALPASAAYAAALEHYGYACATCHGGPGVEPAHFAQAMTPRPPDLAEAAGELTDGELFLVIEEGVRMTGMPAFGALLDEEEIWDLVALVRHLEELSVDERRRMQQLALRGRPPFDPREATAQVQGDGGE